MRTQLGQGADLLIGETGFFAAITDLATQRATARRPADNNALIAKPALDDLACSGVDDKMIGIGCAGDDGFSQTRIGVDDGLTTFASDRIGGEKHARDRRLNQTLHDDGQLDMALIESKALTITHRTICPQRSPAVPDRIEDRIDTNDIEICLLLASKRQLRQVFSGGRRAHRHGQVPSAKFSIRRWQRNALPQG